MMISNKNMRKKSLTLVITLLMIVIGLATPRLTAADGNPMDILVIVNNFFEEDRVSPGSVREIFLHMKKYWHGMDKIIVINSSDRQLRDEFRSKVLKMNLSEEQRYWQDAHVRGNESEPVSLENTMKAVFKLKRAISYVYRKDYRDGLAKVVLVVPAVGSAVEKREHSGR